MVASLTEAAWGSEGKSSRTKSRDTSVLAHTLTDRLSGFGPQLPCLWRGGAGPHKSGPFQLWRSRNLRQEQSLSHAASPVPAQVWEPLLHMAKGNEGPLRCPPRAQSPAGGPHLASLGQRAPQAAPSRWRGARDYSSEPLEGSSVLFPGIGAGPGLVAVLPKAGLQRAADLLLEAGMQDSWILQESAFPSHFSYIRTVQNSGNCA